MRSQCDASNQPTEAEVGTRTTCPECGKSVLVAKGPRLRAHSINASPVFGGPDGIPKTRRPYGPRRAPHPSYPRLLVPTPVLDEPKKDRVVVRGYGFDRHVVYTVQKRANVMEWACQTCRRTGVTTAAYPGQDLAAKVRTNHYQQIRRVLDSKKA